MRLKLCFSCLWCTYKVSVCDFFSLRRIKLQCYLLTFAYVLWLKTEKVEDREEKAIAFPCSSSVYPGCLIESFQCRFVIASVGINYANQSAIIVCVVGFKCLKLQTMLSLFLLFSLSWSFVLFLN